LAFYDCNDLLVEGLTLDGAGGDSIYLGVRDKQPTSACRRVVWRNIIATHGRRQAATVISAHTLLVENSKFIDTDGHRPPLAGTLCESLSSSSLLLIDVFLFVGTDFEPNSPNQQLVNITYNNVLFAGNNYGGVAFHMAHLNGGVHPIDVTMNDVIIVDNWREKKGEEHPDYAQYELDIGGGPKTGKIEVRLLF
jgi:hypothetical protein